MPVIPENIPFAPISLQVVGNPPDLVALKIDAQVEMPKFVDKPVSCFFLMQGHQARLCSFGIHHRSFKTDLSGRDYV